CAPRPLPPFPTPRSSDLAPPRRPPWRASWPRSARSRLGAVAVAAKSRQDDEVAARLKEIHLQILRVLDERDSSYAQPVSSAEIGRELNVTPSYVREQVATLQGLGLVSARRGPGGGYYIDGDRKGRWAHELSHDTRNQRVPGISPDPDRDGPS